MRRGALLLATLALAGCGERAATVGDCLNAKGFLVEQHANVVRGSSPRGVNFTLTLYPRPDAARRAFAAMSPASAALLGDGVAEFAGNPPASPGAAAGKLSSGALATMRRCVAHP